MSRVIDERTKSHLTEYLRNIRTINSEEGKKQRFAVLLGELFPGSEVSSEYSRGAEKLIRVRTSLGFKRGRADTYYGNAVIEFEKSLKATLHDAQRQLCEYTSGIWPKSDERANSLLAIATDGVHWIVYQPILIRKTEKPKPDDIRLDRLREFKLSGDSLSSFWLWLTSFLFRPHRIEPTSERFEIDFGAGNPLYKDGLRTLSAAWLAVSDEPECSLAFDTWQRYLAVTYGKLTESPTRKKDVETGQTISELEVLFLKHTYLSTLARFLIWGALSGGRSKGDFGSIAEDVISGDYFQAKKLANLVDDDFFHWIRHGEAHRQLTALWERIISHLSEYDLGAVEQDILKGVYQDLIDPKDRHDLGEYYTPDWLCERIVAELLPDNGFPSVLDPGCGSGSFLRAVIAHLISHNKGVAPRQALEAILQGVVGIDIHPVAVTIARATYVLALGDLVKSAPRPIQIPIYLADSLFLPHEVEKSLFQQVSGFEVNFGDKSKEVQFILPQTLVHRPELFDELITASSNVAEDHARRKGDSLDSLRKHLMMDVPQLEQMVERDQIIQALWRFTEGLAELIRERKDSIWSFIIRNSYRPAMLREQFQFIIGNPPWLSYRYIADPRYQDEIKKRAVQEYEIAPKSQKLFTQMELATVFLAHAMKVFARSDARLGFVMPRSVLTADQHQKLIKREYKSPFRLTAFWDLWEVSPLFKVPSCVLFASRDTNHGSPEDVISAEIWIGKLPERNLPWEIARNHLTSTKTGARTIYLGSRCAISTGKGMRTGAVASKYAKGFQQGATIVPRNFYFVRVKDLVGPVDRTARYWIETDPEQAEESKKPYKDVRLSGEVEGRFLFSTTLSKHLLPFALLKPAIIVLPVEEKEETLYVRTADELAKQGYRYVSDWMRKAAKVWTKKRKEKAGKQSLYEWLDYQSKLTAQDFCQQHLVLYNAAGKNVSAAFVSRSEVGNLPFVVDHKTYWAAFNDIREAKYLTALLNSGVANKAIKPFQSTGLLGERDIHKKLLELPIPEFDLTNRQHIRLVELCEKANLRASQLVESADFPASLVRRRSYMRSSLGPELSEIDQLASIVIGI